MARIEYEEVKPGYYKWRCASTGKVKPVEVYEDGAGLHIKSFDGIFSEALYGEFLEEIHC